MNLAISPEHMSNDFTGAFDQKIDIFVSGVEGWRLGVARAMRDKGVPQCGFAQVAVVASYFEMIAKYRAGFMGKKGDGKGDSEICFNEGVKQVFPGLHKWPQQAQDALLDLMYDRVRCGLYHIGMTGKRVILSWDSPLAIDYNAVEDKAIINPDIVVDVLRNDLRKYENELRDTSNVDLRSNFERRFDLDFGIKP